MGDGNCPGEIGTAKSFHGMKVLGTRKKGGKTNRAGKFNIKSESKKKDILI